MRLNVTPAGAQVSVVRASGGAVPVSGSSLELDEGSYTVTARAPGHTERTETMQITGGQTVQVNWSLAREVQKPKAVAMGMEGWTRPWKQDGEWYAQKGGGMLLYRPTNVPGSYSFNILHASGGGMLRGKDLEWFAAYTDERNYVLFRMEKDGFRRIEVVNGKRAELPKKSHGLDLKDQMMATVEIEVTSDTIVTRVKKGASWSVIDAYSARGKNLPAGRFGINIRGNDEIRLAGFAFHGKE
jgi:hypothetical protein